MSEEIDPMQAAIEANKRKAEAREKERLERNKRILKENPKKGKHG